MTNNTLKRQRYVRMLASADLLAGKIEAMEAQLMDMHRDILAIENELAMNDDASAWVTKRSRMRSERMAAQYDSGMTLDEVGTIHGITRERVRQLIAPYMSTAKRKEAIARMRNEEIKRRANDREFLLARKEAAVELVNEHGYTMGEAADATQISSQAVRSALAGEGLTPNPSTRQKTRLRLQIVPRLLDAGKSMEEISDELTKQGDKVSSSTLRQWCYNNIGTRPA